MYHALNRGNARAVIFRKDADYGAFERILREGLRKYNVRLYAFQMMPNHWHLVLRPEADGEMSRFLRWVTATHTMRYHAHYGTTGEGHLYQGRFKSFPIQEDSYFLAVCRYVERNAVRAGLTDRAENWRWGSLWHRLQPESESPLLSPWPIPYPPTWLQWVNQPLSLTDLERIRRSAQRGTPLGDDTWVTARERPPGLNVARQVTKRTLETEEGSGLV